MINLPVGKLAIMGQIDVLEHDGESVNYPRALLISFEDTDSIRAAIHSGACRFWFGDEDPKPHPIERQRDELLAALKTIYAAMIRYEGDVDGDAPHEHTQMMREVRDLIARVESSK